MSRKLCSIYYCASWGTGLDKIPDDILNSLDILYYSNAKVSSDDIYVEDEKELAKIENLHKKNPRLKVVLSTINFTGCTEEKHFDYPVEKLINIVSKYKLDGIDVDWEFPKPEEKHLHTLLLKKLRNGLDNLTDKKYLLSVAVPTGEWVFDITELDKSHKYLDYVNVMTYDIYSERNITTHHTAPRPASKAPFPYSSAEENIKLFINKGVPGGKIIIGGAFYSRKWENVSGGQNGLYAETDKPADYGPQFNTLAESYINKGGFVRYWDDEAKAPYLYNGSTFLTYDDEQSVKIKCDLVKELDVAGMMAWEYACDTSDHKLLNVMSKNLK